MRPAPRSRPTTGTTASRPCGCATGWRRCASELVGAGTRDPAAGAARAASRAKPSTSTSSAFRSCTTGWPATSRPTRASASDGAAGALAARQPARLAPPRGEGDLVGVLPPARPVRRGAARREGALAGLEFVERVATPKRSVVDRYRFPPQECEIREGDDAARQRRQRASARSRRSTSRPAPSTSGRARRSPTVHRSARSSGTATSRDDVKREALHAARRLGRRARHRRAGAVPGGRDLLLAPAAAAGC